MGCPRARVAEFDADPLVDPALGFVAGHADPADLAGIGDMCPAVGLEVEPDDLDGPDLLDARRQEVDLRADEIRDRERLVARQDRDPHVALGGQFGVHGGLDGVDQVARHALELEVHAPGPGFHVATRDEGTVVPPDHAAQGVEGGVGAHQGQAPGPLDVHLEGVTDRGRAVGRGLELVGDLAIELARGPDAPGPAVGASQEDAAIRGLPATAGVERGPIEDDQRGVALGDLDDPRLDPSRVGVRIAELLPGRGHFAFITPVMSVGWIEQTKAYVPASSASTS